MEVMIFGAILAILIFAFGTYFFNQARVQRFQEVQQNAVQFKNNLIDVASQPDTISNTEQLDFCKMQPPPPAGCEN